MPRGWSGWRIAPRRYHAGESAFLPSTIRVREGRDEDRDFCAMTAIGIYGSAGRMGRAIAEAILAAGARNAGGADAGEDPSGIATAADVLVDFSIPAALDAHLEAARAAKTPIVIGTTGLTNAHHAAIDAAATDIAVLQTGNTSLGITLLARLVREAAARLGQEWDIEVVEMHHRHKVDAPSGTALLLGEAAAMGRASTLGELRVDGRAGLTGARTEGTIGLSSLRGGSVVGDHSVMFATEGERIELTHRADDRSLFARGAVTAALWLADQPPGRYRMGDVLGL
jgi:4-hydroxy-tetrahydrodipicolinate reductase